MKLKLSLKKDNQMYKNILKEENLINSTINKYFNTKLKLKILFKDQKKKKNKEKIIMKDKDNPLFMDVMNKFKGEI